MTAITDFLRGFPEGKPQFRGLLFRRGEPRFVAFDLLWLHGEDFRYMSLMDRKARVRSVVPRSPLGKERW